MRNQSNLLRQKRAYSASTYLSCDGTERDLLRPRPQDTRNKSRRYIQYVWLEFRTSKYGKISSMDYILLSGSRTSCKLSADVNVYHSLVQKPSRSIRRVREPCTVMYERTQEAPVSFFLQALQSISIPLDIIQGVPCVYVVVGGSVRRALKRRC